MADLISLERVLSRCINMDLNNIETIIRMVVTTVIRVSSNMVSILMDRQATKFLLDPKYDRQKAATKQNERLSSVVKILPGADAFGIKPRFVIAYLNIASCQKLVYATYLELLRYLRIPRLLGFAARRRISKHWIVTSSHSVSNASGASPCFA
jgi:hypothetical protein